MSERDQRAFLFEAIRLVDDIVSLTVDFDESRFAQDRIMQLAVERPFISLGEVLMELRRAFPAVADQIRDLSKVIGMRNVLVHQYRQWDLDVIWGAIANGLRPLRSRLTTALEDAAP